MRAFFQSWLLLLGLLPLVWAECTCSGLDYTNGGSYLIDGSSESKFVFASRFDGMFSGGRVSGGRER